jgi:twitching motility two-component system response regulator PilG
MALRYAVKIMGFAAQEEKLFEFTLGISLRRDVQYELAQHGQPPDLLVMDSNALPAQRDAYLDHLNRGIPIVLVGDSYSTHAGARISRPIRWMKLFETLDALVGKLAKQAGLASTQDIATLTPQKLAEAATTIHAAQSTQVQDQPADSVTTFVRRHQVQAPARDRVLVVDDSAAVRQFMRSRLAAFNVDVDYAESGEQAIAMAGKAKYIAVFLDVVLPGADGYQVCRMIRSAKSAFQPVVVMLTSRDSAFDKIRGKMAGCTSYLTKPVDDELLFETLHKFLPKPAPEGTAQRIARVIGA